MRCNSRTILVVDDEPDILEMMSLVLEGAGYRVCVANNGAQALDELRQGAAPCLILLDLMMPGMDGWEFLVEHARDPRLAAIPVVVLTGAGPQARKAVPLAANDILNKPVSVDVLLATVQHYCGLA